MTDDAGAARPGSHRLDALWVYAIALVPRVALIPWFRHLLLMADEEYYWNQSARSFLEPQFRPPLWPLVLKLARGFSADPFAGRLLSVALGALFVVLVFALARRLFDRKTAWAAALIAAFYPDLVVWSHFLWSETLFSSLLILACLALFPRGSADRTRPLAGSLVLGVALLSKEFAVVMFAALATAHLLLPGEHRLRTVAASFLLFLVPVSAYVGAVSWSSGRIQSPFPAAVDNAKHEAAFRQSQAQSPAGESPGASRTAATVGSAIVENLKRLWGARSFALWRLGNGHYGRPVSTWVCALFVLAHGLILGAGLAGLIGESDARWRTLALLAIGFLSATAIPGFIVSRFRTPFMFLFILGAARTVTRPRSIGERLASPARAAVCVAAIGLEAALLLATFRYVRRWG
jgi:4-amino-4-deoxy-L-arabinose transferase-like glycosyltransferase